MRPAIGFLCVAAIVCTGVICATYLIIHDCEWWGLAVLLVTAGARYKEGDTTKHDVRPEAESKTRERA
jgi:fatty acid desaturase